jgi:hypothetical protein
MNQNDEKRNQCSQNGKMVFTYHMNTTNLSHTADVARNISGKDQGKEENGGHHTESTLVCLEL